MNLRMPGCRACESISSGDCGMHGPVFIPTGNTVLTGGHVSPSLVAPSETTPTDQPFNAQGRFMLNAYGRQCFDRGYEAAKQALAGTAPAPPPPAWQPIETAPKDRTTILGYTPHAAIMVGDVYYDPEQEHWARLPASDARVYPTHWTPLPDPPVVVPSVVKKD